ncbi:hypothetical protein QBC46DRAFT_441080 [Diplogelasinospora grovesii]|uniref:Trichothecene 3-O-acetyltransferase-like N-terminal domain-containing protein n=1 Tax=Diplogelasinospora grovesii TaxID=303347 RepID=A0AAN6S373_9PEZI|nr:hypothetical protein QBC46DRAFT_441080 [Diplogelasinospora grovesii]
MGEQARPLLVLSPWDQVAPRVYISIGLCFPFADKARGVAIAHMKRSLEGLARQRPDFAGTLELGEGNNKCNVLLRKGGPASEIPLKILSGADIDFEATYAQLERDGFPARAFVNPQLAIDGTLSSRQPIPVSQVRVLFIEGGLLLLVDLHHASADGGALGTFLCCFANQTWLASGSQPPNPQVQPSNLELPVRVLNAVGGAAGGGGASFEELLKGCEEYVPLPDPTGPTQPYMPGSMPDIEANFPRDGRIFVFTKQRLKSLQNKLYMTGKFPSQPSNYVALAALTWACVATTRLELWEKAARDSAKAVTRPYHGKAVWFTPVDWSRRAYKKEMEQHFGSSTTWAFTKGVNESLLRNAYANIRELKRPVDEEADSNLKMDALAELAVHIQKAITAVDEPYVDQRTELFGGAPDIRRIGLAFDPRIPQNLGFNTWTSMGADAEWDIPGVSKSKPDAMRRFQAQWSQPGALIMPKKEKSTDYELVITLPQHVIRELLKDKNWMQWVERVIE